MYTELRYAHLDVQRNANKAHQGARSTRRKARGAYWKPSFQILLLGVNLLSRPHRLLYFILLFFLKLAYMRGFHCDNSIHVYSVL
jgi:hypothetical protein